MPNTNKINSYEDLIVWQKSMDFVLEIYTLTKNFPPEERYGIVSQARRAAVSIPSNIAEGYRRGSKNDYRRFLIISFGSGAELETQLKIMQKLNYGKPGQYKTAIKLLGEIMPMLNVLISKLKS